MNPTLAAVSNATVAVLSQSSGIQRPVFAMRRGHIATIIAPLTCCTNNSAVASTTVVSE